MAATDFVIVGIGASAGGIQAIRRFFENVPADSGMAFVVVLHLSPDHDSKLAEVVQLSSSIAVTQVEGRVAVAPDHVYVISPNRSLTLADGHLSLAEIEGFAERRAPVDIFFRTLAESQHAHAVAVVLSGTGANGSMGLKRVKELGGVCLVQDPGEAEFAEMPQNSIATGLADHVLGVADMPAAILAYKRSLGDVRLPEPSADPPPSDESALRDIFALLRGSTGHDLANYKQATVLRRLARRMGLRGIHDLPGYAVYLRDQPGEAQALLKDLLISVTSFFRDPAAFAALEKAVIPRLFAGKGENDHVRVWSAGCATGEEAYSLAMLLAEAAAELSAPPSIQVFASDLDGDAVARARNGLYTLNDCADVAPERLRRFFAKEGERYRVRKELREMILFAHHNVVKDPPFSHLDLISCRNLLIYLNRTAQQQVLEMSHFALNAGGFLFLGSSESIEGAGDLFATVDKEACLFNSRAAAPRLNVVIPELRVAGENRVSSFAPAFAMHGAREHMSTAELHQRLLEQYAPPSVVVNERFDIVHVSDRAGRYLQIAGGDPTYNLLRAVRPALRLELRTALHQAAQQRVTVEARGLTLELDSGQAVVDLTVRPVLGAGDPAAGFFLVLFHELASDALLTPAPKAEQLGGDDAVRHLEAELQRLQALHRATVEHHETQAEELQASNEELQAINEEMRSSAEELETSKEELQSLNEELRTVNQELKIKIEEQVQANDDVRNLINSTEIGTIFLDRQSHVKLFTPRARDVFTLIPADRGRPLSDINSWLVAPDLQDDIALVLERLERVEREVATRDGRWQLMRILPYRTAEERIGGVVLTFVDITERRRTEQALRASEERLRRAIGIETVGVLFFTSTGVVIDANEAFLRMTGHDAADLSHRRVQWQAMIPPEERARTGAALRQLLDTGRIAPREQLLLRRDGSRWWSLFTATRLGPDEAVGFVIDLSEQRRAEELQGSERRLRLILESATDYAIFTTDLGGRIDSWNPGAERMFGYREDQAVGRPIDVLYAPEDRLAEVPRAELARAGSEGQASNERWLLREDGSRFFASGEIVALRDSGGALVGFVTIARDLTERKRLEDTLLEAHGELETRVEQRTAELGAANAELDAKLQERHAAEDEIRSLMRRLITVQEDERSRIARDLHDHLGQQVAGLGLRIDALNELSSQDPALRAAIAEARKTIARLDRDLDFFTWELRPAALDDLGLVATLADFVREWSKEFGIPADYHGSGLDSVRLAFEVETNLYRIAQEALNNVYKHAHAARVGVILERRGDEVVLVIEDDGVGFQKGESATGAQERGIGLLGMHERAAFIGGRLEIESSPGRGTTVFVQAPLGL